MLNNNNLKIKYNLDDLDNISEKITKIFLENNKKIITLIGELGAGKTTLVKKLLKSWGVKETITSPTFTYVNLYKANIDKKDITIYHFDLYRIESIDQFCEMGFEEYLFRPDSISIIEWPEVINGLLEKNKDLVLKINIEHSSYDSRELVIKK